jgi:hypothetical protein
MMIKGRDGTTRAVDDGYVLKDGESYTVAMMMMDAARTSMIHDASGRPAGTRPGFLLSDANEQAVAAAYKEYDDVLVNRWKTAGGRQGPDQSQTTRSEPQASRTFASPQDALADSYRQYDADLATRWQSDRWQDQPSNPTPPAAQPAPQVFDSPQAARDAAHAEYDAVLTNRWRRQW